MGVPEDGGPPGLDVVEQPAPVYVLDEGALGSGDEIGRAPYRAEGAHRGVDAAGDDPACLGEQLGAPRAGGRPELGEDHPAKPSQPANSRTARI